MKNEEIFCLFCLSRPTRNAMRTSKEQKTNRDATHIYKKIIIGCCKGKKNCTIILFYTNIFRLTSPRLMELEKAISKRSLHSPLICHICGDVARGMNFDVITCMPCKTFFRRHGLRSAVSRY